jgi:excisionase family DNA binding protein
VVDQPVRAGQEDFELLQKIAEYLQRHGSQSESSTSNALRAVLVDQENQSQIEIPGPLFEVVREAVDILLKGGAVAIMPYHTQLTTQEAANYLGVSRPHLISLLDEDKISYSRLRSHRRIRLKDLVDYRMNRDNERRRDMAELSREIYDLGLYGLPGDETKKPRE